MKTDPLTVALLLLASIGCGDTGSTKPAASDSPSVLVDGAIVELIGIAASVAGLGAKAMTDGVTCDRIKIQFDGKYERFPTDVIGSKIQVTGTIRKKRAAMFSYDAFGPDAPTLQGIPVPPETDIEKESVYFVIENPQWQKLTDDQGNAR